MKTKLMALGIPTAIFLCGCSQAGKNDSASTSQPNGWTEQQRAMAQFNCEATVKQTESSVYAKVYCGCVFDKITPRWSYAYLQQHEKEIMDAMTRDGSMDQCMESSDKLKYAVLHQSAEEAGFPSEMFGVSIGATTQELKSTRPNVHSVPDSGNLWREEADWEGSQFQVTYTTAPLGNEIFLIELERKASLADYIATQTKLDEKFGPLSKPAPYGAWTEHSERKIEGFTLSHAYGRNPDSGDSTIERITLFGN